MFGTSFARRLRCWWFVVALSACGGGGGGGDDTSPPVITRQPDAATVADGAAAVFSVAASGDGLSFAWHRNGTAIAGATGTSYTTPALTLADNGATYSVLVSNRAGAVPSQPARVTVQPVAPAIGVQPDAVVADDGSEVTFSVHATGSAPLAYQWLRDGVAVPGATASSHVLAPAVLADDGAAFSVRVGNAAGEVTSRVVSLAVRAVAPRIDLAPQPQVVVDGGTARFSVTARGSGTLAYQWEINGQAVPGATTDRYERVASYADDGAQVRVVVSSVYGSAASTPVTLTVDAQAPAFSTEPQDVATRTGASTTFTVTASGTAPLSYQWQRSNDAGSTWTDIATATAQDFTVAGATLAWSQARLRARVTNPAGTVDSEVVALTVQPDVRVIAGKPGGWGYADGQGAEARFGAPAGLALDSVGNLLVSDLFNGVIRQVTPQGQVSTIAGRARANVSVDGPAGVGTFVFPRGLARAPDGALYLGDQHLLRRISATGTVSTIAGSGTQGVIDGSGAAASFGNISAVAVDAQGDILVAEGYPYNVVRKVTPAGVVTTLAGVPQQPGSVDGPGATARFQDVRSLTVGPSGTVYVADDTTVREVLPDGTVSLYAGAPQTFGAADGPRLSARFQQIHSLAVDSLGNLWVGETKALRRIAPDGTVITVAGGACPGQDDVDGTGALACLYEPTALVPLAAGAGVAFSSNSHTIRTASMSGEVTTLAGASWPRASADGVGEAARFASIAALARDAAGDIWAGDVFSLRRITPAGEVTTLVPNEAIGVAGLAFDPAGNFIVVEEGRHRIMRVTPAGVATLVAGQMDVSGSADGPGAAATFKNPRGVVVAPDGTIYVADTGNSTVRRIASNGDVSTVAGVAGQCGNVDGPGAVARLCWPHGLALDSVGRLFVTDVSASTVRRLDLDGTLHTIAGVPFSTGFSEGFVSRFRTPVGIGVDNEGNVYVADDGNASIRRIGPNGFTAVVVGHPDTRALRPGLGGAINRPGALLVLPNGRLVFGSEQAVVSD